LVLEAPIELPVLNRIIFKINSSSIDTNTHVFFITAKDDPRRVVILEMRVILEEKPNNDIVFSNLDNPAVLAKLKDTPFTLKEGCKYKIKLTFRVQHDIVTGLKYGNYIYKIGIRGKKFG
jgi:Rho GDP-dissociation inhibitor